ncbi:type II toxin-antitoxin system RelE/ParE family toxin [soil metagenome]
MAGRGRELDFIYTPLFDRAARGLLDNEAMRHVELELLTDPRAGDTVADAGGIRKLRAALPGRGKRGSARIAYLYFEVRGQIYFLLAYAKGDRVDLSAADRKVLRQLVTELKGKDS